MIARLSKIPSQLIFFKPTYARTYVQLAKPVDTGIKRNIFQIDNSRTPKTMTLEEAASLIKSGDKIFLHTISSTPAAFMRILANYAREKNVTNVEAWHTMLDCEPILTDPSCYGLVWDNTFFVDRTNRKAVDDGYCNFVTVFLSEIPQLFRRNLIKIDYAIIQCSPPDAHGFMTLGPSVDISKAAAECSKKVIAIVNKTVPKVNGSGRVHTSQVDFLCYDDTPIATLNVKKPTEKDMIVGKIIAENLIDNGATLQMGIGGIPDAVLSSLTNHKDLGIHTEMSSDGIIELMQTGAVNNRLKKIYPGRTTSTFAFGSQKLYDFINDNENYILEESAFTNDYAVIRQNPKVSSINACIEVDLTGQIVADSIGKRTYSGIGGQLDFVLGANKSEDGLGKSILTLFSTTNKGQTKIVPTIANGAAVSTSRSHARYIVTEYGIADLFGKGLHQRARALINIAHPDNREQLEKAAFERFKRMPEA